MSWLGEILQAAGGGLIIKASVDLGADTPTSSYDVAALVLGAFMWMGGVFLERGSKQRESLPLDMDPEEREKGSTKALKKLLNVSAGYGTIAGFTQLGKHVDTVSANLALLASGVIAGLAIQELTVTQKNTSIPTIKWEKVRFLFTFLADNFVLSTLKKMVNKDYIDGYDIGGLVIGVGIVLGEALYGRKYDTEITFGVAARRRLIKLSIAGGIGSILSDIPNASTEKYLLADDIYLFINNTLLAINLAAIHAIGNSKKLLSSEFFNSILYDEGFEAGPEVNIAPTNKIANQGPLNIQEYLNNIPPRSSLILNSAFTPRESFDDAEIGAPFSENSAQNYSSFPQSPR